MNTIKIILLGDSGVGKSRICHSYVTEKFCENYDNQFTVGVDFKFKNVCVRGTEYRIHMWDTAGQERFRSIVKSYFRDTDSTILVFDINKINTFKNIAKWINDLEKNCENTNVYLIANKTDINCTDKVKDDEINRFILNNPIIKKFYKISAKSGDNLIQTLNDIVYRTIEDNFNNNLYEMILEEEIENTTQNTKLIPENHINKEGDCCIIL